MTMPLFPKDINSVSPASDIQANFEALEAALPWDSEHIGGICSCNIEWDDGCIIPIENLPIEEILELINDGTGGGLLTSLAVHSLFVQYRDDTTVYIPPGQVAHRGVFRRQPLDEATSKTRIITPAAALNDPAADATSPGTSGLDAETWYFGYAKMDVATVYPEYRFSKQPPINDEGYGREAPFNEDWPFVGSIRTGELPDAAILAFHRYDNGRVFWRQRGVGPRYPTYDLITGTTAGWVPLDLSEHVPVSADSAFLTALSWDNNFVKIRAVGDTGDDSGYTFEARNDGDSQGSAWMEIAVMQLDPATDTAPAAAEVEMNIEDDTGAPEETISVAGYHEPLV